MLLLPLLPSAFFFLFLWAGLIPQVHTDTFSLGLLHLLCWDSLSEKEILLQAALAAALGTLLRVLMQHPQKTPFFSPHSQQHRGCEMFTNAAVQIFCATS